MVSGEVQYPRVEIYTDGACSGNPGPGGWAAVLIYGRKRKEIQGYEPAATNQRMELQAAIAALNSLKVPCRVRLHSDSAYLVNAFQQGWLAKWIRNGWQTSRKTPVENRDLWEQIYSLSMKHQIEWIKVPGHADNPENNRCDQLARAAIEQGRVLNG